MSLITASETKEQTPTPQGQFLALPPCITNTISDTSSLSDMTRNKTWIERGADGRPFYVRKKKRTTSTRQFLADAFAPLRKTSLPFSRSYQRTHHILPAHIHHPFYLPAPPIQTPAQPNFQPPQPSTFGRNNSTYLNMNPYDRSRQQQGGRNSENSQSGILKPAPQTYPAPFPGMYPVPPSQLPTGQHPSQLHPAYSPPQFPGQPLPFRTQPPGIIHGTPLPPGARVISPPRLPTADDLKYRCFVCGRFRSTSYHYKHPIPPGQPPGKTICRKCKDLATDSEDETESTNNLEDRRPRRQRSRSQRRAASVDAISRQGRSRRGRSRSRAPCSEEDDYDYYQPLRERSWSRSSSLEVHPLRQASRRVRLRRRRSPDGNLVGYTERPRRPKLVRRVTYVEELPHRTCDYAYDDESEVYDDDYYVRRMSRPPTPAPRIISRQYSDPFVHLANPGRRQGYLNTPSPTRETSGDLALAPHPRSHVSSHHRVVSAPYARKNVDQFSESEEYFYERGRPSSYRRPPSRSERGRGRSKSQSRFQEDDPEIRHRSVSIVRRARNSVEWPPSEQVEHGEYDGKHEVRYEPAKSSHRRRVSRSRSAVRPEQASRLLRAGDEVTVVEHHAPEHSSEDYDFYDKEGMRVRVREI